MVNAPLFAEERVVGNAGKEQSAVGWEDADRPDEKRDRLRRYDADGVKCLLGGQVLSDAERAVRLVQPMSVRGQGLAGPAR